MKRLAAALGARVVALDVNEDRLTLSAAHGATRTVMVGDPKATRKQVLDMARQLDAPPLRHKIFECSGTTGKLRTSSMRYLRRAKYSGRGSRRLAQRTKFLRTGAPLPT